VEQNMTFAMPHNEIIHARVKYRKQEHIVKEGQGHKQEEGNGQNLKRTASMKVKPGTRLSMDVLSVAEP